MKVSGPMTTLVRVRVRGRVRVRVRVRVSFRGREGLGAIGLDRRQHAGLSNPSLILSLLPTRTRTLPLPLPLPLALTLVPLGSIAGSMPGMGEKGAPVCDLARVRVGLGLGLG